MCDIGTVCCWEASTAVPVLCLASQYFPSWASWHKNKGWTLPMWQSQVRGSKVMAAVMVGAAAKQNKWTIGDLKERIKQPQISKWVEVVQVFLLKSRKRWCWNVEVSAIPHYLNKKPQRNRIVTSLWNMFHLFSEDIAFAKCCVC